MKPKTFDRVLMHQMAWTIKGQKQHIKLLQRAHSYRVSHGITYVDGKYAARIAHAELRVYQGIVRSIEAWRAERKKKNTFAASDVDPYFVTTILARRHVRVVFDEIEGDTPAFDWVEEKVEEIMLALPQRVVTDRKYVCGGTSATGHPEYFYLCPKCSVFDTDPVRMDHRDGKHTRPVGDCELCAAMPIGDDEEGTTLQVFDRLFKGKPQ